MPLSERRLALAALAGLLVLAGCGRARGVQPSTFYVSGTVTGAAGVAVSSGAIPDAYAVTYELRGVAADGLPAYGQVTIMKPPPKPTPENSLPVHDPAMVRKIKRALSILKQDTVSAEDLLRLEREGRL